MGPFTYNDNSIEGEIFIQRVSTFIRRNEEALANGLVFFLKNRPSKVKPVRLQFTLHHLYYISERIQQLTLGVDVGALNIKLDSPHHEPTFISFMANNARLSRTFDADTRSILSINSMKLIVSSASFYWRTAGFSKDPKVIIKDLKYIYSLFTKIPCLVLSPKTKMNLISGYEEYPCDTSVPIIMFKNLQVLEIVEYDPNEIFGWHVLASQLRILVVKCSKISDLGELIFNLVIDDESGRSTFNTSHRRAKHDVFEDEEDDKDKDKLKYSNSTGSRNNYHLNFTNTHNNTHNDEYYNEDSNYVFLRDRAPTVSSNSGTQPPIYLNANKNYTSIPEDKWSFLKQLTVSEASITTIQPYIWKPLSNLVKLNLSSNLLESIPENLDELVNLRYLNFADNLITDLRNMPSKLKHLSTLNLNNNRLETLEGLNNLYVLEKIDLRRNRIKDLNSLKPIILQFIKNPDKLNNVYLANNQLPKNYRIELFNLFNGIKYKNLIKIDDSRPGYFESALLLDADSAFKAFEDYFGKQNKSSRTIPGSPIIQQHIKLPLLVQLSPGTDMNAGKSLSSTRESTGKIISTGDLLTLDQNSPRALISSTSVSVDQLEASLQHLLVDSIVQSPSSINNNNRNTEDDVNSNINDDIKTRKSSNTNKNQNTNNTNLNKTKLNKPLTNTNDYNEFPRISKALDPTCRTTGSPLRNSFPLSANTNLTNVDYFPNKSHLSKSVSESTSISPITNSQTLKIITPVVLIPTTLSSR